ncbi:uncharacterized protein EURHEDRAFT_173953 [Aspergillus ruber CBS 135680]|uniref:Uncharacterized protein n=1 Tax=Aspergillus ruber (strain CBS 135680) TaxID=1388766 RepID=A0A017S8Q1_ASPRC|nr:uncharacterized protein EURHEDRAFT_173953 [Aspergillus ruber CBS 135680]EYE93009.1 hypothetical protein EURHEDRAFT_173953 [Aspergillus ruber CBS 135680]
MKATALLALLGLFGASTTAVPAVNFPRQNGNNNPVSWEFFLFQNTNCTGPQDIFSGNGTTACRNDIRHGSALGFIKDDISPGCVIELFRGKNCTQSVRNVTSKTESTCQVLPGSVSSFDVKCARPRFVVPR